MTNTIPDAAFIRWATDKINAATELEKMNLPFFDIIEPESGRYISPQREIGKPTPVFASGGRMARFKREAGKWVFEKVLHI